LDLVAPELLQGQVLEVGGGGGGASQLVSYGVGLMVQRWLCNKGIIVGQLAYISVLLVLCLVSMLLATGMELLLCTVQALFEVFFRVLKHCSTATSNQAAAAATAAAGNAAAADDASSSKGVLQQPWAASKVHRKFPLLQPALEGLGRYSHLISVEYFNDLMAVLQEVSGCQ
jgi:hypothetical protein